MQNNDVKVSGNMKVRVFNALLHCCYVGNVVSVCQNVSSSPFEAMPKRHVKLCRFHTVLQNGRGKPVSDRLKIPTTCIAVPMVSPLYHTQGSVLMSKRHYCTHDWFNLVCDFCLDQDEKRGVNGTSATASPVPESVVTPSKQNGESPSDSDGQQSEKRSDGRKVRH